MSAQSATAHAEARVARVVNDIVAPAEAALAYAALGWPVLPLHTPTGGVCSCNRNDCDSVGKHPRNANGKDGASTEEDEIRRWWRMWPNANIGIRTGAESGIVVVDFDNRHGATKSLATLNMPDTLEAETGDGKHLYFQHPGGSVRCASGILPGVDLRADGGYVVAPPSLHRSGRKYRFIKNVPLDRALAPLPSFARLGLTAEKGRPTLGGSISEGSRNSTLMSLAGAMRRRGASTTTVEVALLAENAERCDPPLSEREVARIAQSARRYEAAPDLPTRDSYRGSQVGHGLQTVSLAELRERHKGDVQWIVDGYLARGEVVFLAGPGESLKSWIAAHLAAAIDGRFRWLGVFEVRADRVLFVEQERAGNLVYQLNRIEVAERVELGSDRLEVLPPTTLFLSDINVQAEFQALVSKFAPDLVIVNALRDVLGTANENSPTDMAALLHPLGLVAEKHATCVLIIDHFNKAGLTGLTRGNTAHAGTAQKHTEADAVLIAERPRDELGKASGPTTVSVSKRRSGEPGEPFGVSVTDTIDGGVMVRAEIGVHALSPAAQLVNKALESGPALVADLHEQTGKPKDSVRQALSELRAAGLVDSTGEQGKAHTYWRTDSPSTEPVAESPTEPIEACAICGGSEIIGYSIVDDTGEPRCSGHYLRPMDSVLIANAVALGGRIVSRRNGG